MEEITVKEWPTFNEASKLNGTNWFQWHTQMDLLLRMKKAIGFADGTLVRPAAVAGHAVWDHNDVLVRGIITFAIDQSIMHGLDQRSAAALWTSLKGRYAAKEPQMYMNKRSTLHELKYANGESFEEHVKKYRATVEECNNYADEDNGFHRVEKAEATIQFINTFDESWSGLRQTTVDWKDFDKTVSRYEAEYQRRFRSNGSEIALKVYNSSLVCTNCRKRGHTHDKCWAKGGGMEGQGPRYFRRNQNQDSGSASALNVDTPYIAFMAGVSRLDKESWIGDSGCTTHMAHDRRYFIDYRPLEETR